MYPRSRLCEFLYEKNYVFQNYYVFLQLDSKLSIYIWKEALCLSCELETLVNLGYPGDNLDGMMFRVNQIRAVNPKKIFVMEGINGLNFQALEVFEEKYKRLVKSIKESNPNTIVYLQSILPVNNSMAKKIICSNDKIKDANIIIRNIANNNECIYLDIHHLYVKDGEMNAQLSRDGVHLLPHSYKAWADFLKPYIEGNDIITQ